VVSVERLRSPDTAAEESGDAAVSVEVVVLVAAVSVLSPFVVVEDWLLAPGSLALPVVRASAGGVALAVAVASPA